MNSQVDSQLASKIWDAAWTEVKARPAPTLLKTSIVTCGNRRLYNLGDAHAWFVEGTATEAEILHQLDDQWRRNRMLDRGLSSERPTP